MDKEKKFIANYGLEKETTIFDENGSSYRIHIEIMWRDEKTTEGVKQIMEEAKEVIDSLLR